MTSIALSSKWCPESFSASYSSCRIDRVTDCSFNGFERQPRTFRAPPTS